MLQFKILIILLNVSFAFATLHSSSDSEEDESGVPVVSVPNPESFFLGQTPGSWHNWTKYEANSDESQQSSDKFSSKSSESEDKEMGALEGSNDLRYIGCYDVWENRKNLLGDDILNGNNLGHCGETCRIHSEFAQGGPRPYIFALRGSSCLCEFIKSFHLVRVHNSYCSFSCPDNRRLNCGGNFAASAYCLKSSSSCTNFNPPDETDLYSELLSPHKGNEVRNSATIGMQVFPSCMNCSYCRGVLTPRFDYVPQHSPYICHQFCRRNISYFENEISKLRHGMPFALAGWANKSMLVPTCGCADSLENLTEVLPKYCDSLCSDGMPCGSGNNKYMVNVYLNGAPYIPPPHTTLPPIVDPPDKIPTSTTEEPTRQSTETSGEDVPEISIPTTQNEDILPTRPPGLCEENKQCRGIDQYKGTWRACFDETEIGVCPFKANGYASWKCLQSGSFEGPTPNYHKCETGWIKDVLLKLEDGIDGQDSARKILTTISAKCQEAKKILNEEAQYFGHEIIGIFNIVERIIKHENLTEMVPLDEFEGLATIAAQIGSFVLTNPQTWIQLSSMSLSQSATSLLRILEQSGFELTKRANTSGDFPYKHRILAEEVVVEAGVVSKSTIENSTIVFLDSGSYIELPLGWASVSSNTGTSQFIGFSLSMGSEKGIPNVFPNNISTLKINQKTLNGKIMSMSLAKPPNQTPGTAVQLSGIGVRIRIKHDVYAWGNGKRTEIRRKLHIGEKPKAILGTAVCVYWDILNGIWSQDGCKLVSSQTSSTSCECSHLTSFAVLMDTYNYVGKSLGLQVLTLVLCSLSIISLFATIVIFSTVRATHSPRTTITKNLAFCLLVGNTLVLLVTDRHYFNMSESVCTGVAIVTHYVFLTAFMWMAIEGYHLYKMMVHVFDSGNSHLTIIRIVAYGLPLIVIIATGGIGALRNEHAYGGDEFCWLNGNYILAFLVPVSLVVCGNIIVMFITLRTAFKVQSSPNQAQERTRSYKTWVRGCFSITILLGVTWIVGYIQLVGNVASEVAAYIFTILNASQGFLLFIYHCLLNEKVRMAAERRNINYPAWLLASVANTQTTSGPSTSRTTGGTSRVKLNENMKSFFSSESAAGCSCKDDEKPNAIQASFIPKFHLPISTYASSNNLSSILNPSVSSMDSGILSIGNTLSGSENELINRSCKNKEY